DVRDLDQLRKNRDRNVDPVIRRVVVDHDRNVREHLRHFAVHGGDIPHGQGIVVGKTEKHALPALLANELHALCDLPRVGGGDAQHERDPVVHRLNGGHYVVLPLVPEQVPDLSERAEGGDHVHAVLDSAVQAVGHVVNV